MGSREKWLCIAYTPYSTSIQGGRDMLLAVRDLKTYFFTAAGTVRAVDGVSYDVHAGETVALVGESGCGKSVSALSIMRLVATPAGRIVGGEIRFRQQDLLTLDEEAMRRIRGRDIAMIFQEPMRSEEHTSELQSLRHLVCR